MGDPNQFDPNKYDIKSKTFSPDYNPEAFYFVEASETGEVRMPCWSNDSDSLWEIILEVLKSFPEEVGVLTKRRVETEQPGREDEWVRFFGYCSNRVVETALSRFRKFLLRDSTHQFLFRNTETGEYLAFDDYGILWIYSEDKKFKDLLDRRGFCEKPGQPLIYDGPLWRLTAPDSADQMKELVHFLMLEEVETPEQPKPPASIQ